MKKMVHRRGKLELKLIENEKHRILTFKKRRANLLKKVSELKTLCGIHICLVVAGPKNKKVDGADNERQQVEGLEVDTWPQDLEELRSVIHKYRSTHRRRYYCVPDYFADKKQAVNAELNKLRRQISNAKYPQWDDRLDTTSLEQLKTLTTRLDAKLGDVDRRLASMLLLDSSNNNVHKKHYQQLHYSCGSGNALDDTAASDLQLFSIPRPLDFCPPEHTPFHPWQVVSQMTPSYSVSNSISIQTNHNPCISIDRQLFTDKNNPPNNHFSTSFQPRHSCYYKEASSSLNPFSNDGSNSNKNGHSLADPRLFSCPKLCDFQLPMIDGQDSHHITPLYPDTMDRADRHSSIGRYSTYNYNFSQPSNFYVQLPFQFEQNSCPAPLDSNIEDTLPKMLSAQNTGNHFGGRPSSKGPSMPRSRLPTSWTWDAAGIYQNNAVSSDSNTVTLSADSSRTNGVPITRPGALQMLLPTSSNNPMPSSLDDLLISSNMKASS